MLLALQIFLPVALVALSWVDIRTYRLPDVGTLSLLVCGLGYSWLESGMSALLWAMVAALIAYVSFVSVSLAYRLARGRDGLGFGDAKLLAAAGAWLGWIWLPPVVFIGALSALAYVLLLHGAGRPVSWTRRVPFGPFLAFGFYSCWLLKANGLLQ